MRKSSATVAGSLLKHDSQERGTSEAETRCGNRQEYLKRAAIPVKVRQKVFARDRFCQYRDPKTGKKCLSQRYLEVDHIQPVWAKGDNSLHNLRLLCREHNQSRYRMGMNIASAKGG